MQIDWAAVERVNIGKFYKDGYTSTVPIRGIIHIGANDGYEVQWYLKLVDRDQILCFEPGDPQAHRFMVQYPNMALARIAIGNLDARAELHIAPDDGGSTLLPEPIAIGSHTVQVRRWSTYVITTGLDTSRYNCCVIDTQGMELDVLRGMDEYILQFDYFNIECSAKPAYLGEAYAEEVIAFLNRLGYDQITPICEHDDILFVRRGIAPANQVLSAPVILPAGDKLNIGSGQRRFDTLQGWINIDCISRPPDQVPDLVCDARILPYPENSMELCVLHQVYEHFGLGEAHGILKQCYKVLKPGGSLIITVPDMKALAQRWLVGTIANYTYFVNVYGAYQGQEGDRHKWGYSWVSMIQDIRGSELPWATINRFDWREIPGASLARDWWILGVELTK